MTTTRKVQSPGDLRAFLERSPCPFAQLAAIDQCPPWDAPEATLGRIDELARHLSTFSAAPAGDLCVLEILGAQALDSPASAAELIHTLLAGLRDRDGTNDLPLTRGILDQDWDFVFGGLAYFVSLFASFYPEGHSRHSGHRDRAFILLQPERGFRRFGVSSAHPTRAALSERVHRGFARKGVDYDLGFNLHSRKAERYVKPLPGEGPIAWWEFPVARSR